MDRVAVQSTPCLSLARMRPDGATSRGSSLFSLEKSLVDMCLEGKITYTFIKKAICFFKDK